MKKKPFTFQQLQTKLAEIIAQTPPGQRLPSEPKLAQQLGVSRATLREAMRTFETQGLIRRKQGSGTYVIGQLPILDSGLEVLESLDTLSQRTGQHIEVYDLNVQIVPAAAEQAAALGIAEGASLTRVERTIRMKGKPVAWLLDVLPADILPPDDLPEFFSGSVLDHLIARGDEPTHSRTEITALGASAAIAKKLHIQRGDVLLLFTAWLHDEQNQVLAYSESYFLPGHFKFHIIRRVASLHR